MSQVTFEVIFQYGLVYGLILSVLLTIIIRASFGVNPEIWLNDYPPDIQEKYGPISEQAKKQRGPFAILFFTALFGTVIAGLVQLSKQGPGELTFGVMYLFSFIVISVFNLFDLLILDWLIFVKLRPSWIILPGTAGMKGYEDYASHFHGFLVGIVLSLVGALVTAGIAKLYPAFVAIL